MDVKFGDKAVLNCDVAWTELQRKMGLMGRWRMNQNEGLLFPFDGSGHADMTTVGMSVPIDMVFVGGDSKIRKIETVEPDVYGIGCPNVTLVIEAPAGFCAKHGIEVGDEVSSKFAGTV